MTRRMKYSLYKRYYSEYPSHDYDSKAKSIAVDLPDYKVNKMPKEWLKEDIGPGLRTPGGCTVYTWGSGITMNHRVERIVENDLSGKQFLVSGPWTPNQRVYEREIWPGVDRYDRLMAAVAELEAIR